MFTAKIKQNAFSAEHGARACTLRPSAGYRDTSSILYPLDLRRLWRLDSWRRVDTLPVSLRLSRSTNLLSYRQLNYSLGLAALVVGLAYKLLPVMTINMATASFVSARQLLHYIQPIIRSVCVR